VPTEVKNFYIRAKKELPQEYYTLYRIVDKIARANKLDQLPWRIRTSPVYDINAFASESNLLSIFAGLMDQVAGDHAALACIVGHEMAHHAKRHIPKKVAYQAVTTGLANKELEQAQKEGESQKRSDDAIKNILNRFIGINIIMPGRGETPEQIRVRKEKELVAKNQEYIRQQEFEADELGYQFMAKAGFHANGCLRMLEVLARSEYSEFDSTHPAVPKRIERMNALISQFPPALLEQEGRVMLRSSRPLTYGISADRKSLRVDSKFATSGANTTDIPY
jgi:predicted Zn-dependent protease